ncbi:hypothetical protein evm_006823 [Chilo suppressalis]|nr:hypothetical protein evm_006823 [Chilo suppressalis]
MGVSNCYYVFILCLLFCVSGRVSDVIDNNLATEYSLELTQSLNLARQERIQEVCNRFEPKYSLDDLPDNQLEHILIDENHKLLYCYVPKVACTNWKRTLMILTGKWNDTDVLAIPAHLAHSPGMFRNLSSVPKDQRNAMLDTFHKMIIVRNPFERLLSAYRNKLEGDTQSAKYFQCFGRHVKPLVLAASVVVSTCQSTLGLRGGSWPNLPITIPSIGKACASAVWTLIGC